MSQLAGNMLHGLKTLVIHVVLHLFRATAVIMLDTVIGPICWYILPK
jgi:hypothetical protein